MDIIITPPGGDITFSDISEGTVFSTIDEENLPEGCYVKLEHIYQMTVDASTKLEQVPDTNEYLVDYSDEITTEEIEGEDEDGNPTSQIKYSVEVPLTLYNAISLVDNYLYYFSDDTGIIKYTTVNLTLQQ
jgi:hypothetical protein